MAGIDARGLERFFQRILREADAAKDNGLFKLLSTHPPTPERMAFIRANAKATGKAMTAQEWNDLKWTCLQTSDVRPGG